MSTGNIVSIENVGVNSEAIGEAIGTVAGAVLGGPAGAEIGEGVGEALGKVVNDAVIVTFHTHGGSVRQYRYTGSDAIAIKAGADPANYDGERVL